MALSTAMAAKKENAALREATRKQLARTEREFRAAKFVESWSRVPRIK